jgi:cytidylate kinase
MKQAKTFAITISRQLGSGGSYIGQQLAKKMNIYYADREIISKVAKQLSVLENDLESREEKILSFWESLFKVYSFAPDVYVAPQLMAPTDRELYETEASVIEHIAKEHSAVIIGRCGFHILREHTNHVSIFLHGDTDFRNNRIQDIYHVSKELAGKMIAQSDKERALYCKTFTGKEWADARNYDLSINTSKVDIDKTVDLILNYLKLVPDLDEILPPLSQL